MKRKSDPIEIPINIKNYNNSPGPGEGALSLASMVSIHEVSRRLKKENGINKLWVWDDYRTATKTQEIIWQMTGEWKARRSITIQSPLAFHNLVRKEVARLARLFNSNMISCLRDFRRLGNKEYSFVFLEILESIKRISKTRKTLLIQPVLGSKVLHHYFPSIIPVFDDYYISKGVLQTPKYKAFCGVSVGQWCPRQIGLSKPRLQEYSSYLAYCLSLVCKIDTTILNKMRRILGNDSKQAFPFFVVNNKRNHLLWKLDAKLVEYCLMGSL